MKNKIKMEQFDFGNLQQHSGYVQINVFVGKMPPNKIPNYLKQYERGLQVCKLLKNLEIRYDLIPFREHDNNIVTNHITIEGNDDCSDEHEQFKKSVDTLNDLKKVQCADGNWNHDPYMHGMANGLILAMSLFETDEIEYLDKPDVWGCDNPLPDKCTAVAVNEQSRELDI